MRIDKNTTIRLGNRNIVKIKKGDVVIWQKNSEPVEGPDYFYIENTYAGENTITFTTAKSSSNPPSYVKYAKKIEYSTDKKNWNTLTFNTSTPQTITIGVGEKLYLRNDSGGFNYYEFVSFYTNINTSQNCVVGGNINTLINYNDADNVSLRGEYGCFYRLFINAKNITDASNLIIPSTNIVKYYCREMFSGCTSLQNAPTLSATTLGGHCYYEMFYECSKLTTAPTLPATTLASGCYSGMFNSCTSLVNAPALPATTLVSDCYFKMFNSCTSLVNAPTLPATKLSSQCYYEMFRSCKSLTTPPELPATTLADYCYYGMLGYCTSLTTAPELPATTLADGCYNQMFVGCKALTTAPTLPATTLASNCYKEMFNSCKALTTAPELPATTLASSCYNYMFGGCSKLNSITVYVKDISATDCTKKWLYGVASSGTFNNMGFAPFETSASGIPSGWTEVVPEIESITANPDTFTIKSYTTIVKCTSILTITTTTGNTFTQTNSPIISVDENTGDSTRTLTETIPYKGSSYQVSIVQTANDVRPPLSWNVVTDGTYPFQLNSNDYYESTNKGHDYSYSYATLNYSGYDTLVLECINSNNSNNNNYGIISQPDVQLSESSEDDGVTGSTKVFKSFKGESSTNPVQIVIPSDEGSHFITIKYIKRYNSGIVNNDSFQFKVIEP